jgi:hypothetical protein
LLGLFRGSLSEAIDKYWHGAPSRETGKNKDLAAIALNWIPKGTSFIEAEIILEAAEFYPAGDRSSEGEVWYSVRQTSLGNSGVSMWLKPIAPGDFREAGEIEAAIWVNSL